MEENKDIKVDWIVVESFQARQERTIKRLWILVIALISALAVESVGVIIHESLYETVSYEQDGEGINNVNLGEQGDLYGAESSYPEAQIWESSESPGAQS